MSHNNDILDLMQGQFESSQEWQEIVDAKDSEIREANELIAQLRQQINALESDISRLQRERDVMTILLDSANIDLRYVTQDRDYIRKRLVILESIV